MSNAIAKATLALFKKYKNPHNDPVKQAAHDVAISDAMSGVLDQINKVAKEVIKSEYKQHGPGYTTAILADKGVAVNLRINNGAARFDSKRLTSEIIKLGWRNEKGMPLTLHEIGALITACTKEAAPSITITSAVIDE